MSVHVTSNVELRNYVRLLLNVELRNITSDYSHPCPHLNFLTVFLSSSELSSSHSKPFTKPFSKTFLSTIGYHVIIVISIILIKNDFNVNNFPTLKHILSPCNDCGKH